MNVKENEFPTARVPLSKTAVLDVTVCAVLSLFVHVTVVPTLTCKLDGWKERLLMETLAALGVWVLVGVAVGAGGVLVGVPVGAGGVLVAVADWPDSEKVDMITANMADSAALSKSGFPERFGFVECRMNVRLMQDVPFSVE